MGFVDWVICKEIVLFFNFDFSVVLVFLSIEVIKEIDIVFFFLICLNNDKVLLFVSLGRGNMSLGLC